MIPILYDNKDLYNISLEVIDPNDDDIEVDPSDIIDDVVQPTFQSGGIGRLDECVSAAVTTTGDTLELQFEYPVNGRLYDEINNGSIVVCDADAARKPQPFIVYRRELNLNSTVTFSARHISYVLSNQILPPATYTSFWDLRTAIKTMVIRGTTDKADVYAIHFVCELDGLDVLPTGVDSVTVNHPASVREVLGTFVDATGCELEFDRFGVIIHAVRGEDNGVTIQYGGNLTSARQDYDTGETYSGVVPYWTDPETGAPFPASADQFIVEKTLAQGRFPGDYLRRLRPLDLSGDFDSQPTAAQLQAAAQEHLTTKEPWNPSDNLTVSFIPWDENAEGADILASLQDARLYDTVRVVIPPMGTDVTRRVVKTTYNVLLDRYDSMEIGDKAAVLSDVYATTNDINTEGNASGGGFDPSQYIKNGTTDPVTLGGNVAITGTDALFKVVEVSTTVTGGRSDRNQTLNQAVNPGAGWTPIGVVGAYSSLTTYYIYRAYLSGDNVVVGARYTADNASAQVTLRAYVLCLRTSL